MDHKKSLEFIVKWLQPRDFHWLISLQKSHVTLEKRPSKLPGRWVILPNYWELSWFDCFRAKISLVLGKLPLGQRNWLPRKSVPTYLISIASKSWLPRSKSPRSSLRKLPNWALNQWGDPMIINKRTECNSSTPRPKGAISLQESDETTKD